MRVQYLDGSRPMRELHNILVIAQLEVLQRDMKFIGEMANVTFTASEADADKLGRGNYESFN